MSMSKKPKNVLFIDTIGGTTKEFTFCGLTRFRRKLKMVKIKRFQQLSSQIVWYND